MKKICIITISHEVALFYKSTIASILPNSIKIEIFSLEKTGLHGFGEFDLYLVGTTSSELFSIVISKINNKDNIVISKLTFLKKDIEILKKVKEQDALFVNLSENMAKECISDLHRLGINNIRFTPYFPNADINTDNFSLAITAGEVRYIPPNIKKTIDIGNRYLTANTLTEIILKLDLKHILSQEKYLNYVEKLSEQDYSISMLHSDNLFMENRFEVLINNVNIGLIGIDINEKITIFNHLSQKIFNLTKENIIYKNIKSIPIFEKTDFKQIKEESNILLKVNNEDYSIQIVPIIYMGDNVGHYITLQKFFELENRQASLRKQLIKKESTTKYTFDDIITNSEVMKNAKNIAKKMAKTDLSILLSGETGTGKELFAHSIHSYSNKSNMPFIAINCSAIPENLLESELFGYVGGSFTGASKNGKIGLFEQAHKGTIFLDEIETMSINLQIKLLRVLEEKEIMKIGDTKTISIDIRVICATNENLKTKIKNGEFRKDLYYRLNTLPIDIPPLRERKEDILLLSEHIKKNIGADYELSEESKNIFLSYSWDGNVRELKNILEYLKFMDKKIIYPKDLPATIKNKSIEINNMPPLNKKEIFVLKCIFENQKNIGRNAILKIAEKNNYKIGEGEIRAILSKLNNMNLIITGKARQGNCINEKYHHIIGSLIG